MSTLHIEKLNEATLRFWSDDYGLEQELCDHFTFYAPGYRFMPTYRNKIWDGKIRLADIHRKTIPAGLLGYIEAFCKRNEYKANINESVSVGQETVSLEEVQAYVSSLNIHSRGKKIGLRDYQIDAIHKAINREKILALSPTSSGKSAIIYVLVRWHLDNNRKIILTVPTTSLVKQMFSDFADYASEIEWNPEDFCHQLYSGMEKNFEKPVLITTWQSVHALTKKRGREVDQFYKNWDVYIGDEAHRFASNSLQQISNKLVNARWRIGTTGTIQDEKVSKLTLEGSFGPVYKVITTKELMDNKQVVKLKIKCITLNYSDDERKLLKGADYQQEMDYITTHQARNKFIAKLAKACTGNTLVLFQYVEKHGKPLYQLIKEKCPDKKVFYISGETNVEEREEIRKGIDSYENAIIVASAATLSTGVNIPSIQNIIFASPTKSKIRNLQSIGRGLRLREGKDSCTLFDISDDLSWKTKVNHTFKHFKERLDQYTNEQFDFTMTTVQL